MTEGGRWRNEEEKKRRRENDETEGKEWSTGGEGWKKTLTGRAKGEGWNK